MRLTIAMAVAFAATACAQPAPVGQASDGRTVRSEAAPTENIPVTRYRCTDGTTVEAAYVGNAAVLSYQGKPFPTKRAISASGARYIGEDWQWWTKGMDQGTLAPLAAGETIATARGVDCTRIEE